MIDPRSRIIAVLMTLITLFFYEKLFLLLILLILLHLLYLPLEEGPRSLGEIWKKILPLGLFILILWPLFDPSRGEVLFEWAFIRIGRDNLYTSFLMVLRLFDIVLLCSYPLAALSQSMLTHSLVKMGFPYHWAFTAVFAMQAVPDFSERWHKIRLAQQARGLDLEGGRFLKRVKNLVPLLTAVIVSALRDSEHLSYALINRGLDREGERTWLNDIRFTWIDGLFLLSLTLLLLCSIMIL
jgi:energy-coupling factor transport system permease protein